MAEQKKDSGQTVRLRLGPGSQMIDAFDPSIEGVPVLTHEYQDVPASQEQAVKDAATASGVTIGKEK